MRTMIILKKIADDDYIETKFCEFVNSPKDLTSLNYLSQAIPIAAIPIAGLRGKKIIELFTHLLIKNM